MNKKQNINQPHKSSFLISNIVGIICSQCDKPNIHCKGMCNACYSKMYRNTEKGKERMRAYNLSAGKDAQKRYRERNKANKPPKPPKKNCECGKISEVKDYCFNCYQKYYQRKRNGFKGNKRNKREGVERNKKVDISFLYNKVLTEVKKGCTILNACKKAGFESTSSLYQLMSPIQKAELRAYKAVGFVDEDDF
jgi:hypothetical protein